MFINIPTKAEMAQMKDENLKKHHERILEVAESAVQRMANDIVDTIMKHGKITIAAERNDRRNMAWIHGEHDFYDYFQRLADDLDYECIYEYLCYAGGKFYYCKTNQQTVDTFNTIKSVFDPVIEEFRKQGYSVEGTETGYLTPEGIVIKMED